MERTRRLICNDTIRFVLAACIGLLVTLAVVMPYIIMGENSYLVVHDQLDDNFPETVVRADRYFSHMNSNDPYYVDGTDSVGVFPMRIIYKALYAVFAPFTAYVLNYAFIIYVGFIGMYLFMDMLLGEKGFLFSLISASLICFVRLYQDFGLSSLGIPLLIWAFLSLRENKHIIAAYVSIVLYVLESTLVLSGYFCVGITLLWLLTELLIRKNRPIKSFIKEHRHFVISILGMAALYCLLNYPTFIKVFIGGSSGTAQRATQTISEMSFREALKAGFMIFCDGQYHASSLHSLIMKCSVVIIIVLFAFWKVFEKKQKRLLILSVSLFGIALFIGAFYGVFRLGFVVAIRRKLGALGTFQFDRLYCLYPFIWFSVFGILLSLTSSLICRVPNIFEKKGEKVTLAQRGFFTVLACILCIVFGVNIALSMLKQNPEMKQNISNCRLVMSGIQADLSGATFRNFYAEDTFAEIKSYIGKPTDSYRVVSFGMYPSIAYYNGFSCCDGYTPTYTLEYKAQFRKVIAGELEKDESIKEYFDGWGSRCYVFSAELGKNYLYTKNQGIRSVTELSIDANALAELGCEYIISAVEIENADMLGITFEKTFDDSDGIWQIYLYKV